MYAFSSTLLLRRLSGRGGRTIERVGGRGTATPLALDIRGRATEAVLDTDDAKDGADEADNLVEAPRGGGAETPALVAYSGAALRTSSLEAAGSD